MVLFIMLYKVVVTCKSVQETTIQMRAAEQYFQRTTVYAVQRSPYFHFEILESRSHCSLGMQECSIEFDRSNDKRIMISNNRFIKIIQGDTLDLVRLSLVASFQFYNSTELFIRNLRFFLKVVVIAAFCNTTLPRPPLVTNQLEVQKGVRAICPAVPSLHRHIHVFI